VWGDGIAPAGGNGNSAQTHAFHWGTADPVAHHETLCSPWAHTFRALFGLQGLRHPGVLFKLPSPRAGCAVPAEPWRVTLIDTGEDSMTGGRLKRVAPYLSDQDAFCFTYGDGVADVDLSGLIRFHQSHGRLATVTAVKPPGRFGALSLKGHTISDFQEKPAGDGAWINGGFFVLSPKTLDFIEDDQTVWEREPMERLAKEDQFRAFFHEGFWQPMDTLRDKGLLEDLWQTGQAPWKRW